MPAAQCTPLPQRVSHPLSAHVTGLLGDSGRGGSRLVAASYGCLGLQQQTHLAHALRHAPETPHPALKLLPLCVSQRSDLTPAFVKLLRDPEAEVRIAAAGKVAAFCKMLTANIIVQQVRRRRAARWSWWQLVAGAVRTCGWQRGRQAAWLQQRLVLCQVACQPLLWLVGAGGARGVQRPTSRLDGCGHSPSFAQPLFHVPTLAQAPTNPLIIHPPLHPSRGHRDLYVARHYSSAGSHTPACAV